MVNHRRGPWSQHEDQWLINLVHRNGAHNWVRISQEIQTRSPKQCRERYHQNLKPSLNHEPITPEEGEQIERLVQEMGKRWAEIARRLKGRSDNAVKNWWNGGQNRRKRNPDRADHPNTASYPSQTGYPYAVSRPNDHHHEGVALPLPINNRDGPESHVPYYAQTQTRRPSLNPSSNSPQNLRLPPAFEHFPGSRPQPQPLELYSSGPYSASRGRGFETPMPSPSGYSIVSADGAPSLITDTGSEARSPRGAASPLDITLAPLVGGRDERKNSCTRYLPQTGFAVEDDDHSVPYDHYKRRASLQLPPLNRPESASQTPVFREPNYKAPLLTQPASHLVHHHHTMPASSVQQRPLPAFSTLAEPGRVAQPHSASSAATSPFSRQLPPVPAQESKSAPASPRESRDSRMNLGSLLS